MRTRLFIAALTGASLLAGLVSPAAGQATSTSGQAPSSYTVRPGDTLYGIARRFGTTIDALAAANNRSVQGFLFAGQVLRLPGAAPVAAAAAPAAASGARYTVRAGDTLWGIAQRHRTTLAALTAANGITPTAVLLAGRTLALPAGAAPAAAPAPAAQPSPAPAAAASGTTHVVRPGESFGSIASRYGTTPRAVAEANGLPTAAVIVPGQVLQVPSIPVPPGTPAGLPVDLLRRADALALVPVFRAAATEFGVPVDLLMSLAYRESAWRTEARSPSGAIGIGQLLPASAVWVATTLLREPGLDPTVATDNVRMSARLLRWMLDRFGGDTRLALAAYFDGPGTVSRTGVSPVAERYAQSIMARRSSFA